MIQFDEQQQQLENNKKEILENNTFWNVPI